MYSPIMTRFYLIFLCLGALVLYFCEINFKDFSVSFHPQNPQNLYYLFSVSFFSSVSIFSSLLVFNFKASKLFSNVFLEL